MLTFRRGVGGLLAVLLSLAALPIGVAAAEEPWSAVEVTPTEVEQGQTFTVTETVYNARDYAAVTNGRANLYGQALVQPDYPSLLTFSELVSCTGDVVGPCGTIEDLGYTAPVGTVPALGTATVVFTLRLTDDAPPGGLYLRHQFVGDFFGAPTLDGPTITILEREEADLAVTLNARAATLTIVEYTATATNSGPSVSSGAVVDITYPAGLTFNASTTCTVTAGRIAHCPVGTLPVGQTATVRFTARTTLLLAGTFTATAVRVGGTPPDPNPANDQATRSCSALTGLIVSC